MDYESIFFIINKKKGWYSVTPEDLAYYIAKLAGENSTCIDAFAGSGGNVIQFSRNCKKVIGIDIDKNKIDIIKNNCEVYNCPNNIEIIHSDFLKISQSTKADYIFLSPPWGGLDYKNNNVYSLKKMVTPDFGEIIKKSLSLANNIMFYLPRTIDINELFDYLQEITGNKLVYLDVHILESARKIKAILLIYGPKAEEISKNEIKNYIKMTSGEVPTYKGENDDFSRFNINWEWKEVTRISKYSDYKIIKLNGVENEFGRERSLEKKDEKENIFLGTLLRIISIIGVNIFFESILRYNEKLLKIKSKGKNKNLLSLFGNNRNSSSEIDVSELIVFLVNEVLTDKQLARINI